MQGPMLQALLEDRFKLKIRRETREVPVYVLTVGKERPQATTVYGRNLHSHRSHEAPAAAPSGPKARLHQHDLRISEGSEHGESVHAGGYFR